MDVNIIEIQDGDQTRPILLEAPSLIEVPKEKLDAMVKKKRRRGKSKQQMKPFMKVSWQDKRKNDKTKKNNRFRKIVLSKTQAPFNNNQFLMEIHKPEPENNFHIPQTPSARTRDSSFSVDSEDNYFYSLPEDEEEYLTKEFSSVYEDAQCERLSNMTKNDLIQEYLLLEAKYDNLIKRSERSKPRYVDDERETTGTEKDTDKDSMVTDRDTSATSIELSVADESINDMMQRMKEYEDQISELQTANEKLRIENERLRKKSHCSSEDSESDSSSTSVSSSSSSSRSMSPANTPTNQTTGPDVDISVDGDMSIENYVNGQNEVTEELDPVYPLVNGIHSPDP